jgi:hypothetical protein
MSSNNSQGLKRRNLNYKNHVLDLFTRAKVYVKNRLYDRGRKICNYTSFFKSDGILPANESAGKTGESIPTESIIQLTRLSILIKERKKRHR